MLSDLKKFTLGARSANCANSNVLKQALKRLQALKGVSHQPFVEVVFENPTSECGKLRSRILTLSSKPGRCSRLEHLLCAAVLATHWPAKGGGGGGGGGEGAPGAEEAAPETAWVCGRRGLFGWRGGRVAVYPSTTPCTWYWEW